MGMTDNNIQVATPTIKSYLLQLKRLMKRKKPEGWHYSSMEDLLLQEGKSYALGPFDEANRVTIYELYNHLCDYHGTPKPKQCYYNSQTALMTLHPSQDRLRYVEGYALSPNIGIPIPHGFLTFDQKVVDFTWYRDSFGIVSERNVEYYGIEIHRADIAEALIDTEMAQSHLDNWWADWHLYKNKFTNNERYYIEGQGV